MGHRLDTEKLPEMPRIRWASCKAWPLLVPLRQPQGCCVRSSRKALSEDSLLPLCSPRRLFSLAALKSSGWTTVGLRSLVFKLVSMEAGKGLAFLPSVDSKSC